MKKVVSGSGSSCPCADQAEDCASVSPSHTESLEYRDASKPEDVPGKSQWDSISISTSRVGLSRLLNQLFAPRNEYPRMCWYPKSYLASSFQSCLTLFLPLPP